MDRITQHRKTYSVWRDLLGLVRHRSEGEHRDETESAPEVAARTAA